MEGLGQVDLDENHLQLMIELDKKNLFLYLGDNEEKIEVNDVEENR
jgi:hypothetical protein